MVFDGNHLLYRAYYKFANLKTIEGIRTSITYGLPYISESLIRRLSPTEVITTFDGEKSKFRLGLLPGYKDRVKKLGFDAEDFHRQKITSIKSLQLLGIKVALHKELEADDVIAMITRRYKQMGYEVIIVSGDKDFNQLIDKKVSVFNSNKGIMLTKLNLQKLVGYKPEQTVDYLSLLGDASDKIPGYPGIGEKKALNLLDTYGSVKTFLESGDTFGKTDNKKLKELIKLNKKLIDLNYFYRKFLRKMDIPFLDVNPKLDINKFKLHCAKYEINSFLKTQFIKTFNKLYDEK